MRKTGKIIKCIICNKDFYCKRVHLPTRKFCSSKCYWLDKKETSKGENNPFYGKKHSVANNEINRKAHLGKPTWNKNVPMSEKSRKKLSEKLREGYRQGRKVWNKGNHKPKPKKEFKPPKIYYGKEHHRWKGGVRQQNGYVYIYYPNHPRGFRNTVSRAIFVIEKHIGRYLTKSETPHHINGIKDDDRIENLYLFASKKEHNRYHGLKNKPEILSNLS